MQVPMLDIWIQRSPDVVLCREKKNRGEVHEENDGKSTVTARVHIQHMVQRRRRNRVVSEGNKW